MVTEAIFLISRKHLEFLGHHIYSIFIYVISCINFHYQNLIITYITLILSMFEFIIHEIILFFQTSYSFINEFDITDESTFY